MSRLIVQDLQRSFGGVQAVRGVSFTLAQGELLALIGPNGAGKSTCFNLLNGQLRPDAGTVRLDGVDLVGLPPRRIAAGEPVVVRDGDVVDLGDGVTFTLEPGA